LLERVAGDAPEPLGERLSVTMGASRTYLIDPEIGFQLASVHSIAVRFGMK
jgi:hypothetical protein